jgi:DNA-binding transcriptional ArsR family regulator
MMTPEIQTRASLLFAALGYPVRLRIVQALIEQPRSVGDVSIKLGILQSSASQHLSVLSRAGIVKKEQQGAQHVYSIRGPRIKLILQLIEEFCSVHGLYGDDPVDEADERQGSSPENA